MARVVSADLDPGKTRLSDVMTTSPDTVAPSDSAYRALSMMNEHGYRHLPILDGETIVGIVSVRDLFRAVQRELEEGIQEREAVHRR